jgi:hypothetical protein
MSDDSITSRVTPIFCGFAVGMIVGVINMLVPDSDANSARVDKVISYQDTSIAYWLGTFGIILPKKEKKQRYKNERERERVSHISVRGTSSSYSISCSCGRLVPYILCPCGRLIPRDPCLCGNTFSVVPCTHY